MEKKIKKKMKLRLMGMITMNKRKKTLVKRYNLPDMIMHWTVAAGFVLALLTGYAVFFEGTSALLVNEVGNFIRLLHRIGGVLFVVAPILYFIFSKKRFGFLRAFKWNKSDFGWLLAAPKHYFVGGDGMLLKRNTTLVKNYFTYLRLYLVSCWPFPVLFFGSTGFQQQPSW